MEYYAHPTAVIDAGARIGSGTRIWHWTHLMGGCTVGADCNLGQNVFVADDVRIGDRCKVQNNVSLYTGVILDDEVFVGPSAVFTNVSNPRAAVNRRGAYATTRVGKGVTIGANATIVCGVTLEPYAFIGAGAVITADVPAYALMLGVPARRQGWMSAGGHRLDFDAAGNATCPAGGRYRLRNGRVRQS